MEWDPPSSSNVSISGYYVFYILGTPAQTQSFDNSGYEMLAVTAPPAVIEGLIATQSYRIQVQALTTVGNETFQGIVDTEILQVLNTTVNTSASVLDTGIYTITISLPRSEEFAEGALV